jgi:predicted TIM-barrel fold metal-dependent hydrolase
LRSVHEHRLASDFDEYTATLLRETNTDALFVDVGFPVTGTTWQELGDLAGSATRPILRIESVDPESIGDEVAAARSNGFIALKTIAAYRGGLDRVTDHVVSALEANERTGAPLPVQVHCGFGDSDLWLARADPSRLKPLLERFAETTFVVLHCYPFVREAGWLAHVYGHVYLDLSLTIPHVARPEEMLREALELAPVSKLLYASDAACTPELYFLAATWWRRALAEVTTELLDDDAESAARAVLRENACRVYDWSLDSVT